jgi:hypothetical protein
VIVGSAIDENNRMDMPSGVARACDPRTGKLRWSVGAGIPIPDNTEANQAARDGDRTLAPLQARVEGLPRAGDLYRLTWPCAQNPTR